MKEPAAVLVVATMDTKGTEVSYLEGCLRELGIPVLILDAGILGESPFPVTISRHEVAAAGGMVLSEVRTLGHEGKALAVMISGAIRHARDLQEKKIIGGILGLGGSMGTTLGTGVMRAFPVGFPKLMISTMASRNTRSFVGTKDILMLHAICDLSGINRVTRKVLRNGALAIAGMVGHRTEEPQPAKPLIVLSTLGTTEAAAQIVRRELEKKGCEVMVFHTVGSGGEAMEEIIQEEDVKLVVDLSLHEILDHLFGGDYDAGPNRGATALARGVPTILVPGNTDFLVSGPLSTAEQRFPGRLYHVHNAAITCVRSEPKEVEAVAMRIAQMCGEAKGPVTLFVPMAGFSAFDRLGGPFYDPEATRLFAETVKKNLAQGISFELSRHHINDPEFGDILLQAAGRVLGQPV